MKLVIAEKPSVASDIARIIKANRKEKNYYSGNGYIVTWAIGHLIALSYPDEYDEKYKKWEMDQLPILPENFKKQILEKTKQQFYAIKALTENKSVAQIICATDSGREGQLIFEYIIEKCNIPKEVEIKRLWINSLTEEAIKKGFQNLLNNDQYFNLKESASARAEADWLFGNNFSRFYSLKYNANLSVGRVQTPTLSMIVKRDDEIENFVSEPYFELWVNYNGIDMKFVQNEHSKFIEKEELEKIQQSLKSEGVISFFETKNLSKEPPTLYDLTALQKDANEKYSMTANETLNVAQSLYEKHKLITYPRTESRYLPEDMKPLVEKILFQIGEYRNDYKRFTELNLSQELNYNTINNEKISDHHAIIPNVNISKTAKESLSDEELRILDLIIIRFIISFAKAKEIIKTKIEVENNKYTFKREIDVTIKKGYEEIIENFLSNPSDPDGIAMLNLNNMKKGDFVKKENSSIKEKRTSPPKKFTESSLLSAMQNVDRVIKEKKLKEYIKERGLGTPATRAAIIETLINKEYISRKKNIISATDKGKKLIEIVHPEIKSCETTAMWEEQLKDIEKGKIKKSTFIENIKKNINEVILLNQSISEETASFKEIIGKCPVCENEVYEGKLNFYCSSKECPFVLWKEDLFLKKRNKKITKKNAKEILKNQKITFYDLKSKAGNIYAGTFFIKKTIPHIEWGFEYVKKKQT